MNNNTNKNNNHQGIALVIAIIAAASLLSLGAIAAPAFAGGNDNGKRHDGGDGGDKVKQVNENTKAKCKQNFEVEDGSLNTNVQTMGLCAAIAANINDVEILSP